MLSSGGWWTWIRGFFSRLALSSVVLGGVVGHHPVRTLMGIGAGDVAQERQDPTGSVPWLGRAVGDRGPGAARPGQGGWRQQQKPRSLLDQL